MCFNAGMRVWSDLWWPTCLSLWCSIDQLNWFTAGTTPRKSNACTYDFQSVIAYTCRQKTCVTAPEIEPEYNNDNNETYLDIIRFIIGYSNRARQVLFENFEHSIPKGLVRCLDVVGLWGLAWTVYKHQVHLSYTEFTEILVHIIDGWIDTILTREAVGWVTETSRYFRGDEQRLTRWGGLVPGQK